MKKKWLALALGILMVIPNIPAYAAETDSERSIEEYSMGEIQNIIKNYLEENQIELTFGTEEFYNFVVEQLIGDNPDENLKEHPQYDLIHAYLVEYLVDVDSNMIERENQASTSPIGYAKQNYFAFQKTKLDKTIGDIIEENNHIEEIDNNISGYAAFDGDAAADYAIKYATVYNSAFTAYSSDCTNFVSQALNAGGKNMHGTRKTGTKDSTKDWYHYRYISDYHGNTPVYSTDVTTSFIRVADFVSYITPKSTKKTCSTHNALISGCSIGDVFFAADKTTKTPYHAMIITKQDSNGTYYCGHTLNRKNRNVTTIDLSDDVLIRFHIN